MQTKFACDTNLVSPKMRQVSHKLLLQKQMSFFTAGTLYTRQSVALFLREHRRPFLWLNSCSHRFQMLPWRGIAWTSSLEKLSDWSVTGFSSELLVSRDAGLISCSLSDDSCSLSLTNGIILRAEIFPLTDTDCSLMTPVTHPFLKLEVHWVLGQNLLFCTGCAFLFDQVGTHHRSLQFERCCCGSHWQVLLQWTHHPLVLNYICT